MGTERITFRLGSDLKAAAEAYSAEHSLDMPVLIRLALIEQMKRKPPMTLPDGAERAAGNPNIADIGKAGADARWGRSKENG